MQKFIDGLEKKEDESELSRGVHHGNRKGGKKGDPPNKSK